VLNEWEFAMKSKRKCSTSEVVVVLAAACGVVLCCGCDLDGQEFRTAAGPALEAGVTTLATGLIDGAFAVYMPDDEDNNSAGTSSSDSTGS
jgi:hypothetical protein